MTEVKYIGNMKTLAFQVPEELFQKIKDYLQRNNMTQKEFVVRLIEQEIERDLTQRAAISGSSINSKEAENEEFDEEFDVQEDNGISMEMWGDVDA